MSIVAVPINGETWLICGGRDFTDADGFGSAMSSIVHMLGMPARVVHGDCPTGADALADAWARFHAIDVEPVRADWKKHRKAAGPIRNQEMLDRFPIKRVVAFPGGRGTADMTARARKASIPIIEIPNYTAQRIAAHPSHGSTLEGEER